MERLTEREPYWLGEEFWTSAREPDEGEIDKVYERLKHYEDLQEQLEKIYGDCDGFLETVIEGLVKHDGADIRNPVKARLLIDSTAEKWLKWKAADEQGRLLELPCAAGDIVWTNLSVRGWYFRKKDKPYKATVVFIGINGVENFMNVAFENGHMMEFKFSDIGKNVFLTREEAQKALEEKAE